MKHSKAETSSSGVKPWVCIRVKPPVFAFFIFLSQQMVFLSSYKVQVVSLRQCSWVQLPWEISSSSIPIKTSANLKGWAIQNGSKLGWSYTYILPGQNRNYNFITKQSSWKTNWRLQRSFTNKDLQRKSHQDWCYLSWVEHFPQSNISLQEINSSPLWTPSCPTLWSLCPAKEYNYRLFLWLT